MQYVNTSINTMLKTSLQSIHFRVTLIRRKNELFTIGLSELMCLSQFVSSNWRLLGFCYTTDISKQYSWVHIQRPYKYSAVTTAFKELKGRYNVGKTAFMGMLTLNQGKHVKVLAQCRVTIKVCKRIHSNNFGSKKFWYGFFFVILLN